MTAVPEAPLEPDRAGAPADGRSRPSWPPRHSDILSIAVGRARRQHHQARRQHRRLAIYVTGTRADYGPMRSVLRTIERRSGFRVALVVTGMHLARRFGRTVDRIHDDGFEVLREVPVPLSGDGLGDMAAATGRALEGIARAFEAARPDVVLVFGDRPEMLAAAYAAAQQNIPCAHVQAGDRLAGANIDDAVRFATTKLAHIHFCATRGHARRVLQLGEERWRIHAVGTPGLDEALRLGKASRAALARRVGLDFLRGPYLLVCQHPTTIGAARAAGELEETLAAVRASGLPAVCGLSNADAGGRAMHRIAERAARASGGRLAVFPSLAYETWLALLRNAVAIAGNSSSGIIEAPSFGVPCVNVGERQAGRERGANVIDVPPRRAAILAAIARAQHDRAFLARVARRRNPYGDGRAGERIARVLRGLRAGERLLRKAITY